MPTGAFVAYYRVSTKRQGQSGLGIEAQREAVRQYLSDGNWQLKGEFCEVESGRRADRPQLTAAMAACRVYGARLVIAKLDRLSRDAHFLLGLQKAGIGFVAADMPDANELTVGIMAVVAQAERQMISNRTKAALSAAKARGRKLGGFRGRTVTREDQERGRHVRSASADNHASDLSQTIATLRAQGAISLRELADGLTLLAVPTPAARRQRISGITKHSWKPVQVLRVLVRINRIQNRSEC